jgi:hypothetical protein
LGLLRHLGTRFHRAGIGGFESIDLIAAGRTLIPVARGTLWLSIGLSGNGQEYRGQYGSRLYDMRHRQAS